MPKKKTLTVKIIVTLALLAALSIVLTRILAFTAGPYRFSIGNMPIVLSGILFGPLAGALTGFVADFIGANFLSLGWSPQLAPTPILMGLIPGLLRLLLKNKVNYWRLLCVAMPSYILGSMGWTTYMLTFMYGQPFLVLSATRVPTYAITLLVDTLIIFLLFRSGIFRTLGISAIGGKTHELPGDPEIHS